MNIGILGSGDVAKALAKGFIKHGYSVMLGTRDRLKLEAFSTEIKSTVGSFADAGAFGDIIVLAVKGHAAVDVLKLAGVANLRGKTIIDTTNPIANTPPENGVLHFYTDLKSSLMEQLQVTYPDGRFVKAFSCVGNSLMANPDFGGTKPTMFICGNDDEAKRDVSTILVKFGWEVDDYGKAQAARAIEPLCILWCIPGFLQNEWQHHALKMLKR